MTTVRDLAVHDLHCRKIRHPRFLRVCVTQRMRESSIVLRKQMPCFMDQRRPGLGLGVFDEA